MINVRDTLVLDDDNEYVVVSKTTYNDEIYYYILDKNNNENFKFCYQVNDELIEIEDDALIKNLIPLFFENAKEEILGE